MCGKKVEPRLEYCSKTITQFGGEETCIRSDFLHNVRALRYSGQLIKAIQYQEYLKCFQEPYNNVSSKLESLIVWSRIAEGRALAKKFGVCLVSITGEHEREYREKRGL